MLAPQRNAVHEYVGASNAAACLAVQRAELGLVGHTHVAAAWRQTPRGADGVRIRVGEPLDLAGAKWLLNPGAVGAPAPTRLGWWNALDLQAADGVWLFLDLERRTATWRRAPYDPAPARQRARRSASTTSPAESVNEDSARLDEASRQGRGHEDLARASQVDEPSTIQTPDRPRVA